MIINLADVFPVEFGKGLNGCTDSSIGIVVIADRAVYFHDRKIQYNERLILGRSFAWNSVQMQEMQTKLHHFFLAPYLESEGQLQELLTHASSEDGIPDNYQIRMRLESCNVVSFEKLNVTLRKRLFRPGVIELSSPEVGIVNFIPGAVTAWGFKVGQGNEQDFYAKVRAKLDISR